VLAQQRRGGLPLPIPQGGGWACDGLGPRTVRRSWPGRTRWR